VDKLTTAQAAEVLGVSPNHIRNLYRLGKLCGQHLSPRVLLFDPAAVEEYARTRRKPGRPPTIGFQTSNSQ